MKKSKNKLVTIGLFVLIIINISALVTIGANTRFFKQKEVRRFERLSFKSGDQGKSYKRFVEPLNLTSEQKEDFEEIMAQSRKEMRNLYQQMSENRNSLNQALTHQELDLVKIESINEKIVITDSKIRDQIIELNIKMRKVLDNDQLKEYLKVMSDWRHRERGFSGHRPSFDMSEPILVQ